eukprot:Hpha_TRINITY_DN6158_c0_g1::TRINITY_DN6158_c0_g1_i1::g.164906::m.164906
MKLLVLLVAVLGVSGDVDCGTKRALNCYACAVPGGTSSRSSRDSEKACGGDCRWSRSLRRCLKRKGASEKLTETGIRVVAPAPFFVPRVPRPVKPRSATAYASRSSSKATHRYLLVGFIEQQLASATSLGLHQVLRTAHALNRTAVLPRARFDEPSYRTTLEDGFFPIVRFYDRDDLFGPWKNCAKTSSYPKFIKDSQALKRAGRIQNEIDVIIVIDPEMSRTDGVKRSCDPALLKAVNTADRRDWFRKGVDKVTKVVDTFGGVVTVGDVVCVSRDSTADQLKLAFGNARSIVMMTPDDKFLATPWHQVCEGIPDHVRFKPRIAKDWEILGARLTAERFGERDFACIHIRMEKLIRQAYLAKLVVWKWQSNTSVTAPYLDRCIRDMQLVIGQSLKVGDRAVTEKLMLTDMQSDFGSVTEHVDTKEDLLAYRAWLPTAEQRVRRGGAAGFCGTEQHSLLVKSEEQAKKGGPAAMLVKNPRACAWAEATMCRRAPVILRFGGGSFSNFATAERGKQYETCDAIAAQAALFRSS